jgi:hypothetical protein
MAVKLSGAKADEGAAHSIGSPPLEGMGLSQQRRLVLHLASRLIEAAGENGDQPSGFLQNLYDM